MQSLDHTTGLSRLTTGNYDRSRASTKPPALPETAVEGQDCSSRFFRWAYTIGLGDEVNSERLLQEMNTLGYLGLAVGYFSKRLPKDRKKLGF